jgi:hypothetical protein
MQSWSVRSNSVHVPSINPELIRDLARLRTDFERTARGGIDGPKADGLIRRVRRGRLYESEANLFKREVVAYSKSFTADGRKRVQDFIQHEMRRLEVIDPGPHPDPLPGKDPPVIKSDRMRVELEVVKGGKLFIHGIRGTDPAQNYIGDCYLMAAMSAVAYKQPSAIRRAFKLERDGSYNVTLYKKKGGRLVPRIINIDADLPRDGWYGYYYAGAKNPKELWPALLEKAFAARAGSYDKIQGGMPGDAMEAITGKKSSYLGFRNTPREADKVWAAIGAAMRAKKPTCAATLGDSSRKKFDGTNIYSDHTYAVFGVSESKGVRYVHLRNPWGEGEPKGNGRDDGVFELPLDEFMRLFSSIAVNG